MNHVMSSFFSGIGGYVPEHILTNDDLAKTLDTSHEWIEARTGICQRHIVQEGEFTSDLAFHASQKALEMAGIQAEDLDIIIVATTTPDYTFPSTATLVQNKIGSSKAIAFDLNAACSGFIFAIPFADSYLKQNKKKHALIIGAESMSKIVDWSDRSTAVLFGDGAGAVILSRCANTQDQGLLDYELGSDGQGKEQLYVSGGVCRTQTSGTITMRGQEVFRNAVTQLERNAKILLERNGLKTSDLDWVVPHQANKRILMALVERLEMDPARMMFTGDRYANTSAASIPLTLWEGVKTRRIEKGQLILLQAFGAGFTWGSCLFRL